ncbi:flagellar protein FliT [Eionea flava]
MKRNLFLSMLDTTKDMLKLAQVDRWEELAKKEKNRQDLIEQVKSSLDEKEKENQMIIIEIVKEINSLNEKINQLAENKNNQYQLSLIGFKKGQKAKEFYLDK